MALFGFGKDKEAKPAVPTPAKKEAVAESARAEMPQSMRGDNLEHVLKHPRITEKATAHGDIGAYVFEVSASATKKTVMDAVHRVYQVRPRMIRIVPIPSKSRRSMRTGHRGTKRGGKKAYVYLKKGETITIT